jgi:hypothetical protein
MFVTDDVFHADRSLEKSDEDRNMYSMLVTDDVFHADTSLAKLDEY